MRRLDRAMVAMFLLVLLADFARADAFVPVGLDASGGLILSAATHSMLVPDAESADGAPLGVRQRRLNTVGRESSHNFGRDFKRASVRKSSTSSVLARGIFDGPHFALVAVLEPVADVEVLSSFAPQTVIAAPSISVVEHLGSPAP